VGFLTDLFTGQFTGYRPAIEISGGREQANFTLTNQFGRLFTLLR